ncbi:hypothetical protein [Methylocucumis oryzae]|uniref:Uncharacterized protein n=1 Tax=Methylocucumis oryzae TaxID=1632867 RepID=A0A0F3ILF7_9GAMM|nr:hypothetical protein [Methylocucumis oryzae]KJV07546.1 hypothetical protein VZ94_04145 [Methylocucumis oryzae]
MNIKTRLAKLETSHRIPKMPDKMPDDELLALIANPDLMPSPWTDEQCKAIIAGRSIDEMTDDELIFLMVGYGANKAG